MFIHSALTSQGPDAQEGSRSTGIAFSAAVWTIWGTCVSVLDTSRIGNENPRGGPSIKVNVWPLESSRLVRIPAPLFSSASHGPSWKLCQTQILLSTSLPVGTDGRMLIKGLWFITLLLSLCFHSPEEEASLRPCANRVLGIVGNTSRLLFLTWTLVYWI